MTKVLIIQRTFEHYRIPVFSELASREDIDLIVSFPYEGRKKSNYADVEKEPNEEEVLPIESIVIIFQ